MNRTEKLGIQRRRALQAVVAGSFSVLAWIGKLLPMAWPSRHGVERIRDVRYGDPDEPAHVLDVYMPKNHAGPLPAVLYVHGGGFQHMSKSSHWLMGIAFARRGYVVFSIDYRLAPKHPFPAAIQDVIRALDWVGRNAEEWGGDASRLILAGESAGANLVAALAVAHCFEPPAPWVQPAFDAPGVKLAAVAPACGVFQVDDPARLYDDHRANYFVREILKGMEESYLPNGLDPAIAALASPLVLLESEATPARPLPPFFLPVGGGDVLARDHERMASALAQRGVPVEAPVYGRELHAFHALVWRKAARACWADMFAFLDRHVAQDDA